LKPVKKGAEGAEGKRKPKILHFLSTGRANLTPGAGEGTPHEEKKKSTRGGKGSQTSQIRANLPTINTQRRLKDRKRKKTNEKAQPI